MTKKQKIDKILSLVKKMEQNTFLLPDSWSEVVNMVSRIAHYKTYVGGRNEDRYINIEYTNNAELYNPKQEDCYTIEIRKDCVYLKKRLSESKNEVDIVLDIVEAIYKEKISFELMDKRAFEKNKKMKELKESIKSMTKDFEKIKDELSHFEEIRH